MPGKRTRPDIAAAADRVARLGREEPELQEPDLALLQPEPELAPVSEPEPIKVDNINLDPPSPPPAEEKPERKKTSFMLSARTRKALEDLYYDARQTGQLVNYSDIVEEAIMAQWNAREEQRKRVEAEKSSGVTE